MSGRHPDSRQLRVLVYHTIADLAGAPILEAYAVPPARFRRQLDILQRFGFPPDHRRRDVGTIFEGRSGLPRERSCSRSTTAIEICSNALGRS